MESQFISVEAAAGGDGGDDFRARVRTAVIPILVRKSLLTAIEEDGRLLLADDEALARFRKLGVERFSGNAQGYSFAAVRAPIDQVATALEERPGVAGYRKAIKPRRMPKDASLEQDATLRHAFLVKMRDAPDWSVLLNTVHWFHTCDAVIVTALASALSRDCETRATAMWDDDFSGDSMIVFNSGNQVDADSAEEQWEDFHSFFYEQGISLPECFIGVASGDATVYVDGPEHVERADYLALRVPTTLASDGPHAFEKLGMMAQALEEGLDDEAAFMAHMQDGIWRQASALLASGEF